MTYRVDLPTPLCAHSTATCRLQATAPKERRLPASAATMPGQPHAYLHPPFPFKLPYSSLQLSSSEEHYGCKPQGHNPLVLLHHTQTAAVAINNHVHDAHGPLTLLLITNMPFWSLHWHLGRVSARRHRAVGVAAHR